MIDFLRRNLRTALVGGGILLASVIGVVLAVVLRPGDEGFLKRGGFELRWDRSDLPVSCFFERDLPPEHLDSLERARLEIWEILGREFLAPCLPWEVETAPVGPREGILYVRTRSPREVRDDVERGAQTSHRYDRLDGRIRGAEVAVDLSVPGEFLDRVYLHEIGHVAGLDHDRERISVMYPNVYGLFDDAHITSADAERLRRIYKP